MGLAFAAPRQRLASNVRGSSLQLSGAE